MHNLISPQEQQILSGIYDETFNTFANRNIVVYKEPIKTAIITRNPNNPELFGMGDGQVQTQYSYIPVSGVFPAIVRYTQPRKIGLSETIMDTNTFATIGEVKIKVKPDCYAFIENGQTDKISFDNRDFYFAGKAQACPFMGNLFYLYQLKPAS